jgi:hypothetical protein
MQTTRRHPRTMEEAFGPYGRGPIIDSYSKMDKADKIVVTACIIVGLAFVALLCMGVI